MIKILLLLVLLFPMYLFSVFAQPNSPSSSNYVKEFPLPSPNAEPLAITSDHNGHVWFTENKLGRIAKLDPLSGKIEEFSVPTLPPIPSFPEIGYQMWDIKADSSENIWFTTWEGNQIIRFNPKLLSFEAWKLPKKLAQPFQLLIADNDLIWFTEHSGEAIGKLNTKTGNITEYNVHSPLGGLAMDEEGRIWFAKRFSGSIGVIDPSTGKIEEYAASVKLFAPTWILVDRNGIVWLTDQEYSTIVSFNPQQKSWASYFSTREHHWRSEPMGIALDAKGDIWFSLREENRVAVFRADDKSLTEYYISTPDSQPALLTIDRNQRVWFTELAGNKVAMIDLTELSPPFDMSLRPRELAITKGGTQEILVTVRPLSEQNLDSLYLSLSAPLHFISYTVRPAGISTFRLVMRANEYMPTGPHSITVGLSNGEVVQGVVIDLTVIEATDLKSSVSFASERIMAVIIVIVAAIAGILILRRITKNHRTYYWT